jgi:hypothetical protein
MAGLLSGRTSIPTGVAIFPRELYKPPRAWADALYNIVHWSEQPKVRAPAVWTTNSCPQLVVIFIQSLPVDIFLHV